MGKTRVQGEGLELRARNGVEATEKSRKKFMEHDFNDHGDDSQVVWAVYV